jgi:hypothetical protein
MPFAVRMAIGGAAHRVTLANSQKSGMKPPQ